MKKENLIMGQSFKIPHLFGEKSLRFRATTGSPYIGHLVDTDGAIAGHISSVGNSAFVFSNPRLHIAEQTIWFIYCKLLNTELV